MELENLDNKSLLERKIERSELVIGSKLLRSCDFLVMSDKLDPQ
jgi:hypothetical protein